MQTHPRYWHQNDHFLDKPLPFDSKILQKGQGQMDGLMQGQTDEESDGQGETDGLMDWLRDWQTDGVPKN